MAAHDRQEMNANNPKLVFLDLRPAPASAGIRNGFAQACNKPLPVSGLVLPAFNQLVYHRAGRGSIRDTPSPTLFCRKLLVGFDLFDIVKVPCRSTPRLSPLAALADPQPKVPARSPTAMFRPLRISAPEVEQLQRKELPIPSAPRRSLRVGCKRVSLHQILKHPESDARNRLVSFEPDAPKRLVDVLVCHLQRKRGQCLGRPLPL